MLQSSDRERILKALDDLDTSDPESLEPVGKILEGMSFNDVLSLGRYPEAGSSNGGHNDGQYKGKGRLGILIEERFFGYEANSEQAADFSEAGVELKTTPFNRLKSGRISAGERLVITMIPYDREIESEFKESHAWTKIELVLLVYYEREKEVNDNLEQKIHYVWLFTPSQEDLEIIKDDYQTIVSYITQGEADQLSESLTNYLGACTKGSTAASSWVTQFYPTSHGVRKEARRRAFSLKRQYMDFVLQQHIADDSSCESVIKDERALRETTFEDYVSGLFDPYIGRTDREISEIFNVPLTHGKSQWRLLTSQMLKVKTKRIEEFEKANIEVRTIALEPNGRVKESLPFETFDFQELVRESEWEESKLFEKVDSKKFLFVVYQKISKESGADRILKGVMFWSVPASVIEGEAQKVWARTRGEIEQGVVIEERNGRYFNSLPDTKFNSYFHVRPHAAKSAYKFEDGTIRGDIKRNASELPDGRWMTKQSFWMNNTYLTSVLAKFASPHPPTRDMLRSQHEMGGDTEEHWGRHSNISKSP